VLDLQCALGPTLPIAPDAMARPLLVEDITDGYVNALNHPSVRKFLISGAEPYTRAGVAMMVKENFEACDSVLFGIFLSGKHSGNVRLHDINPKSAYIGIAMFDTGSQGRGFGSKAIATISKYGIFNLGIERILAGIDDRNLASLRAFAKAGFTNIEKSRSSHDQLWSFDRSAASVGSPEKLVP
jgi:RimJ/RimL family protein N-acetyltransferase